MLNSITNKKIYLGVNWDDTKREIVSNVVDTLMQKPSENIGDIRRLIDEVSKMQSFSHLEHLEDGSKKAEKAKNAVAALKQAISNNDEAIKRDKLESEKKANEYAINVKSNSFLAKLDEIKNNYYQLTLSTDAQKRGYDLESIMYDIFELFDLDPKASFKNKGEQLDGAFTLDGTDYLFEAKWKKGLIGASDLDAFNGKISRKLDNTLGLFLSINGFSKEAVDVFSNVRSSLLLMDGFDLMSVLENQIDLKNLILRKKRHAAQTGMIFYKIP